MSAGPKYEYLWADGVAVTKPVRVPAREYVDLLMTWIEGQIHNETIFPTSTGALNQRGTDHERRIVLTVLLYRRQLGNDA
jgi:MOB kinase activator 1